MIKERRRGFDKEKPLFLLLLPLVLHHPRPSLFTTPEPQKGGGSLLNPPCPSLPPSLCPSERSNVIGCWPAVADVNVQNWRQQVWILLPYCLSFLFSLFSFLFLLSSWFHQLLPSPPSFLPRALLALFFFLVLLRITADRLRLDTLKRISEASRPVHQIENDGSVSEIHRPEAGLSGIPRNHGQASRRIPHRLEQQSWSFFFLLLAFSLSECRREHTNG